MLSFSLLTLYPPLWEGPKAKRRERPRQGRSRGRMGVDDSLLPKSLTVELRSLRSKFSQYFVAILEVLHQSPRPGRAGP
jgi:hypothetical protein